MLSVRRMVLMGRQMSPSLPRKAIAEWCILMGSRLVVDDGEISSLVLLHKIMTIDGASLNGG